MNFSRDFFSNGIVGVGVMSWAAAQIIKTIINCITTKSLDLKLILSSGGMPSSHSSFVSSVAVYTGMSEGFDSPIFALAFCFAIVVMYDAAGVRRAAGKQAEILNIFIANAENIGIKIDEKLKELLGHSPIEVFFGALLGIAIAVSKYIMQFK